jgi:hypothetical protein
MYKSQSYLHGICSLNFHFPSVAHPTCTAVAQAQVLTIPDGMMVIISMMEKAEDPSCAYIAGVRSLFSTRDIC